MSIPRLGLTAGEPAGIGPELLVRIAQQPFEAELIAIADPKLLTDTAAQLRLPLTLHRFVSGEKPALLPAGQMRIEPVALTAENHPGRLNPGNAEYVLATLHRAAALAGAGEVAAIVTAPVHKGVINDAGFAFTGHTELFAGLADAEVVMLLVAGALRVALATTHLPLAQVPAAITRLRLQSTLRVLHRGLQQRFDIATPRIAVLGLNPHAGEGGHLGSEEQDTIAPVLAALRAEGMDLRGPLPADTAFLPPVLADTDAVLAMYHDQGLPVLKHVGFGQAVNVTLGLPYVRTSVDHGTALDLAGRGLADPGSLLAATRMALQMALRGPQPVVRP